MRAPKPQTSKAGGAPLKIKPLADRVLVKPSEAAETKTTGGIIIPDTAKEKPQEGVIVAVGPGRTDENGAVIKMNVKVGDKVLYSKYGGNELKFDGEQYLIMSESDILAIIGK
jgi:chaperonin GroES